MDIAAGQTWTLKMGPDLYVHSVSDDTVAYSHAEDAKATHTKSIADFRSNLARLGGELKP